MDTRTPRKRVRIVDEVEEEMEIEEKPRKRGRTTPRPVSKVAEVVLELPVVVEDDDDDEAGSDEEYFEDNTDPLATIVVEGLVNKLSLSKEKDKDKLTLAVKDALKGKSILTDEYCRSRPADQLWKVGLDTTVVRRLEPQLIELREEMEADKISIPKILNSDLAKADKKRALELYDALQNVEPFTAEFIIMRDDLVNYIKTHNRSFSVSSTTPVAVKGELEAEEGELLKLIGECPNYRQRILELNAPREIKARIYEKWLTFKETSTTSEEYAGQKKWLDHALNMPYNEMAKFVLPESPQAMNSLLTTVSKSLNKTVYGLSNVKQELLQVLAQRITNPVGHHPNLALVGPPGIGKSLIYSSVAEAYGIPFERVSLGGLHDPAVLKGHSSTYIGAEPGLIVKILKRIKCSNGMIFFDEIDKLGQTERGREVQYALLHLTDATTNKDFRDTYLSDIPIDLSRLWFVFAMNNEGWLDSAMRDRLHILRLKSYKRDEKEAITQQFLLPTALKDVGMAPNSVTFTPEALREFVAHLPSDQNVRPLKDEMGLIIGKINLYRASLLSGDDTGELKFDFTIPNFKLPLTITTNLLRKLRTPKEEEEDNVSKRMMYL